jgi:hypothetical protein
MHIIKADFMQNDAILERIRFSLDVYFLSQEYKKHCLNKEMLYDDIDKITSRLSKEEGIHLYKDISIIENDDHTTILNCSLPLLGNFMYDAYDLNRGAVTIHKLYTVICIKFIYKADESSDDKYNPIKVDFHVYLITGTKVGVGASNEPVIRDIKVVKTLSVHKVKKPKISYILTYDDSL